MSYDSPRRAAAANSRIGSKIKLGSSRVSGYWERYHERKALEAEERRQALGERPRGTKTQVCIRFKALNFCKHGNNCVFAHDIMELAPQYRMQAAGHAKPPPAPAAPPTLPVLPDVDLSRKPKPKRMINTPYGRREELPREVRENVEVLQQIHTTTRRGNNITINGGAKYGVDVNQMREMKMYLQHDNIVHPSGAFNVTAIQHFNPPRTKPSNAPERWRRERCAGELPDDVIVLRDNDRWVYSELLKALQDSSSVKKEEPKREEEGEEKLAILPPPGRVTTTPTSAAGAGSSSQPQPSTIQSGFAPLMQSGVGRRQAKRRPPRAF